MAKSEHHCIHDRKKRVELMSMANWKRLNRVNRGSGFCQPCLISSAFSGNRRPVNQNWIRLEMTNSTKPHVIFWVVTVAEVLVNSRQQLPDT